MKNSLLLLLGATLLSACNLLPTGENKELSIARAYDHYLTDKDVASLIDKNTSKNDSIRIVSNYIEYWIQQQLMLKLAETNLDIEELPIHRQIEDYKNSLVIFEYEQQLIDQKVDTTVKPDEILRYYEDYENNFLLKSNIIKFAFIKIEKEAPKYDSIRYWFHEGVYHERLINWCNQYASKFSFDSSQWHQFVDLKSIIPTAIDKEENFIIFNSFFEDSDTNNFSYLVNIHDYRIKNGSSPISYVKQDIKDIILNKRKVNFVQNMYLDIYRKAYKNKDFETY